jgi:hypothetical protein
MILLRRYVAELLMEEKQRVSRMEKRDDLPNREWSLTYHEGRASAFWRVICCIDHKNYLE